uniref:Dirigent protein n=1 Tax=Oryza punctata TaxID=4537 RepID=A0A0E0LJ45_ORYPU
MAVAAAVVTATPVALATTWTSSAHSLTVFLILSSYACHQPSPPLKQASSLRSGSTSWLTYHMYDSAALVANAAPVLHGVQVTTSDISADATGDIFYRWTHHLIGKFFFDNGFGEEGEADEVGNGDVATFQFPYFEKATMINRG